MKKIVCTTLLGVCMSVSSLALAYDSEMAKSYARLFSPVAGATAGKALHFVSPEEFMRQVREGNDYLVIDVRTPAETEVFTLTLANSMAIPANQVFVPANLDRIPTDRPVTIVCKSGARATAIGTSLRHIGFDNVYILGGGFQALASYYGPGQAYEPAKQTPDR